MQLKNAKAKIYKVRGHSTIMKTKFYPILTLHPIPFVTIFQQKHSFNSWSYLHAWINKIITHINVLQCVVFRFKHVRFYTEFESIETSGFARLLGENWVFWMVLEKKCSMTKVQIWTLWFHEKKTLLKESKKTERRTKIL